MTSSSPTFSIRLERAVERLGVTVLLALGVITAGATALVGA